MGAVLKAGSIRVHADVALGAGGVTLTDELQARHDAALAGAYRSGFDDGAAAARADGEAAVPLLIAAVRSAAADALDAVATRQRTEAATVVETAFALATWIVDGEVTADPELLERRVAAALEALLPTAEVTIRVAPTLVEPLTGWSDGAGVVVRADGGLRPGEARIEAGHAGADLTFAEALRRLHEVLHLETDDGVLPVTHPEVRTHPGQVADPADLTHPADPTPGDAE